MSSRCTKESRYWSVMAATFSKYGIYKEEQSMVIQQAVVILAAPPISPGTSGVGALRRHLTGDLTSNFTCTSIASCTQSLCIRAHKYSCGRGIQYNATPLTPHKVGSPHRTDSSISQHWTGEGRGAIQQSQQFWPRLHPILHLLPPLTLDSWWVSGLSAAVMLSSDLTCSCTSLGTFPSGVVLLLDICTNTKC